MWKCRFCEAGFGVLSEVEEHESLHVMLNRLNGVEESNTYPCEQCSEVFSNPRNLAVHIEAHLYIGDEWIIPESPQLSEGENPHVYQKLLTPLKQSETGKSPQPSTSGVHIGHRHSHCDYDDSDSDTTPPPQKKMRADADIPRSSNHQSTPRPSTSDLNMSRGVSDENNVGMQVGGGSDASSDITLSYDITKVGERRFKNTAVDQHFEVKFTDIANVKNIRISDLYASLEEMFDSMLAGVAENFRETDLIRVVIHHEDLSNPIFIPLRPLGEMSGARILEFLMNVLNSNQNLTMNTSFSVNIGIITLPAGGRGNHINNLTRKDSSLYSKRSIIEIKTDDNTCLPRAVLVTFFSQNFLSSKEWQDLIKNLPAKSIEEHVLDLKKCPYWYYKEIRKPYLNAKYQTCLCRELCRRTNLPLWRPHTIKDMQSLEDFFAIDILVVDSQLGNRFSKVPDPESTKERCYIYLVQLSNGWHYHGISKISAFFSNAKFCQRCLKPYNKKHDCQVTCDVCDSNSCISVEGEWQSCRFCHRELRSNACNERHLQSKRTRGKNFKSRCESSWKCVTCKSVVDVSNRSSASHKCGEWRCNSCKSFVDEKHLCYIRALEPKDPTNKLLFFDVEATQDTIMTCSEGYRPKQNPNCEDCRRRPNTCRACSVCTNCESSTCGKAQHRPNLIVCQSVCNACADEVFTPDARCIHCGSRCQNCNEIDSRNTCFKKNLVICAVGEKLFLVVRMLYKNLAIGYFIQFTKIPPS